MNQMGDNVALMTLMNRRRALMVFSGAFEFKRDNNKEIKERENDEVELPKLAKAVEEHERNISKPPTDQVTKYFK